MALTQEQVRDHLARVLDHVAAKSNASDAGESAAVAEALRELVNANPNFAQAAVDKFAQAPQRARPDFQAKQEVPTPSQGNTNPAPTGGVQGGAAAGASTGGSGTAGGAP